MESTDRERLAVLVVAVTSMALLWFGGGLAQAAAVSHTLRPHQFDGRMSAHQAGDYLRVFALTVAPQVQPAGNKELHVPSRWSVA